MGIFNRFLGRISHPGPEKLMAPASMNDFTTQMDQYHQLMLLQDSRQLLEVFISGHKNSFQSMITEIDFVNGRFSLDEFTPYVQYPESLIQQTIVIKHHKGWQLLDVKAMVIDWSDEDHCYHLSLPHNVAYQPRRSHQRLILASNNILNTHINPLYGSPWYATVKDISLGGMRVNIPGDLRPHLHKGKVLPKCQIMLDDQQSIVSRGQVKAFSYISKPYRHTEVSIEFENMSQKHNEDLRHFIQYVDIAA